MHLDKLYPSEWLKPADLNGQDIVLTIAGLGKEKVGRDNDERVVIRWQEPGKKKMILNRTNGRAIGEQYGKDTAQWGGKPVQLYVTTIEAFSDMHEVIRVRENITLSGDSEASAVGHAESVDELAPPVFGQPR